MKASLQGIATIERASMADQVTDRLILAIASRQLAPGARVIEGYIAEVLGVSRVPVREAVQRLTQHGVLEQSGPRGVWVAAFDETHVREIYELRLALEMLMMRRAMPVFAADPSLAQALDVEIDAMALAEAERDALAVKLADLAFHRHVLQTSGHKQGLKAWEGISYHVQIIFGMELYRAPDFGRIREQHIALKALLLSGDTAALEVELAEHIAGQRSLIDPVRFASRPPG